METSVLTPLRIFGLPQHLVVPLFQRPYVWDQEGQWQPLWDDIRRVTELRLEQPGVNATHFLGAVVLQASDSRAGQLSRRDVIDGQQRLTSLQLFVDATAAVFEERGLAQLTEQLGVLVHNQHVFAADGDTLKLRHGNRDAEPFREVMLAEPPIDYATLRHHGSRLIQAHAYFAGAVAEWLGDQEQEVRGRADALARVLTEGLQLVVIDLHAAENSQEIFETLNARGTPLTAADLIKNFVFQRLAAEQVDARHAYRELWPFDTEFWEKEVSTGRYLVSRSSLFLNQWLTARTTREIGPTSTFGRFKSYVEHESDTSMADLLITIREQAKRYQGWIERAADANADLTRVELCVYRTQAVQSEVLKPVLLWLHEPGRKLSESIIDRITRSCESWIVRRSLLRLTSADLGRVIADMLVSLRRSPAEELPGRVDHYLQTLTSASTFWPDDGQLQDALEVEQAYRRFPRPRLRMYLEAAEDERRGYAGAGASRTGMRVPRKGFAIEHLLPQQWRTHWPVQEPQQAPERDQHVHRLGNLTLLTSTLNSAVSNGPWLGADGKRVKLEQHDVFLLNREVHRLAGAGWDEDKIDQRTTTLVSSFIATWPAPEGYQAPRTLAPATAGSTEVHLRDLLEAGLLAPGTKLHPRSADWGDVTCEVLADGNLRLMDQVFTSPSAAGLHLRGGATNGWTFWRLTDGRRLRDIRDVYQNRVAGVGQSNEDRQDFFSEVLDQVVQREPAIRKPTRGRVSWTSFASGPFGYWSLSFLRDGQCQFEAYLDCPDAKRNIALFDSGNVEREHWEATTGLPLIWDRMDGRRACRIAVRHLPFALALGEERSSARAWAVDVIIRMYHTLNDTLIARARLLWQNEEADVQPFSSADFNGPEGRLADLERLADLTSRRLSTAGTPSLPGARDDPDFFWRRYVPVPRSRAFVSVGVRRGAPPGHPMWLRLHRGADGFEKLSAEAQRLQPDVEVDARGHLWWPLVVEAGSLGEVMVGSLVEQAQVVLAALVE